MLFQRRLFTLVAPTMLAILLTRPVRLESQTPPTGLERWNVAIEALKRLQNVDLDANPAVKAGVLRVVDGVRDTPQFVELVRDFKLKGFTSDLLDYAIAHPNDAAGVDALRYVVASGEAAAIGARLKTAQASQMLEALGHVSEKELVPLLEPLLGINPPQPLLQKQSVHALAQTQEGANLLLKAAENGSLTDDSRRAAALELQNARWPQVKTRAAEILPAASPLQNEVLPPIAELVRVKGDAQAGAEVFARETVGCMKCHQVEGRGIDFGPSLSEIGTKLAKEAIYEAILDPSAGIAFGYDAWLVELKGGDEAFGLLSSETAEDIAIKATSGIITRYKKAEILRKTKQSTSIMPAGLAQTMSRQDLINLVEFLTSLQKHLHP